MVCKFCGSEVADNAKFCTSCGNPVQANVNANNSATPQNQAFETYTEPYNQQPVGSAYNSQPSDPGAVAQKPKKSRKKLVIAIIAVLVALAVAITGVLVYFKKKDNGTADTAKKAYSAVLKDEKNEFGETKADGVEVVGVCYAELIDFDGDGEEEFLTTHNNGDGYEFAVYSYDKKKGSATQVGTGKPAKNESKTTVKIVKNGDKKYVKNSENKFVTVENSKLITEEEQNESEYENVSETEITAENVNELIENIENTENELENEESSEEETPTVESIYYNYIDSNFNILDFSEIPSQNISGGIISALINDFDGDGQKDMIVFSCKDEKLYLDLYEYTDGKVSKCDSSENEIYLTGAGVFSDETCGFFEDNLIKIQSKGCSFGGSSSAAQYISYKVENKKLVLVNDFNLSEFYRYDTYEYSENVSEKKYTNLDEFNNAVKSANFNLSEHSHLSSDSKFDIEKNDYDTNEIFKGNHIFTVVDSQDFITSGIYGFIHDNTSLRENLTKYVNYDSVKTISDEEIENLYYSASEFHSEYIYGPCEYQDFSDQLSNGSLSRTAYGDIDTYDEFLAEAEKYFTHDTAVGVLSSISAQDSNGKLYTVTNGGVGSTVTSNEITIEQITPKKYKITTAYIWADSESTEEYVANYLSYTNDGTWKLSSANFEY